MTTSRLKLYNSALVNYCGERSLSALTDNSEARRLLDQVYDDDGIRSCLASAQWKFAMRTVRIDYDSSIEPDFGYRRVFPKPIDWCLTSALCSDEYFRNPLLQYNDEAGYWYADIDSIYVRYVSDDSSYGGDYSLWPPKFTEFVAAHFAEKIILKLSGDKTKWELLAHPRTGIRKRKLDEAKSHDAMADPAKFLPQGSWRRARYGSTRRNDGGNPGSLTG